MALNLQQLKDRLGLDSMRQARRRLDLARPLITQHLKHGKNNQLIIEDNALIILERIREQEKQGKTIEQAIEEIQEELARRPMGEPRQTNGQPGEVELLKVKVQALEQRVSDLLTMLNFLKEQLALPRPQEDRQKEIEQLRTEIELLKRPWWQRMFSRRSANPTPKAE